MYDLEYQNDPHAKAQIEAHSLAIEVLRYPTTQTIADCRNRAQKIDAFLAEWQESNVRRLF